MTKTKSSAYDERRAMRSELKNLSTEVRKREKRIVSEIIRTCDIILCTTVGAASSLLRDVSFDVCIIDEVIIITLALIHSVINI